MYLIKYIYNIVGTITYTYNSNVWKNLFIYLYKSSSPRQDVTSLSLYGYQKILITVNYIIIFH